MTQAWEGDEYGEPLPIVTPLPDGTSPQPTRRRRSRRFGSLVRRHNTPIGQAEEVRQRVIREAQGKVMAETPKWRQALADGKREAAAAALTEGKTTHNAGSGFGLA